MKLKLYAANTLSVAILLLLTQCSTTPTNVLNAERRVVRDYQLREGTQHISCFYTYDRWVECYVGCIPMQATTNVFMGEATVTTNHACVPVLRKEFRK